MLLLTLFLLLGCHAKPSCLCYIGFLDKLQTRLQSEGGIKALLGMVRSRHPDVLSQVARGIANFAKCESRASSKGKSLKLDYLDLQDILITRITCLSDP